MCVWSLALSTALFLAQPLWSAQVTPLKASKAQNLVRLIARAVKAEDIYPKDTRVVIEITGGGAQEIRFRKEAVIFVPVRIHASGSKGGYCRVAVLKDGTEDVSLIRLPIAAQYPSCEGMRKMAEIDLNGDDMPDFVFQVDVESNRYAATVSEGAVYMSQPNAATGYCYAPQASAAVTSDLPFTEAAVRQAIRAEIARRGNQILDCYREQQ